jgi:hypothetical protein
MRNRKHRILKERAGAQAGAAFLKQTLTRTAESRLSFSRQTVRRPAAQTSSPWVAAADPQTAGTIAHSAVAVARQRRNQSPGEPSLAGSNARDRSCAFDPGSLHQAGPLAGSGPGTRIVPQGKPGQGCGQVAWISGATSRHFGPKGKPPGLGRRLGRNVDRG